ncbi:hypothetical protein V1638_06265 [Pseudarthrobacter sp. J64]|uniref:hypothetical protein n=1 Tax=Pseudarthrobacter sp. J64 TaxID=3116485 RepID=UPI002E7FE48D|nr:hypothetical protein [Pseudarthrobacter sp. J64]MEE2569000.1 hypothetical protein [Pseudarthrobacter sp. J64]
MHPVPRITVEVPVLSIGTGPADYEALERYATGLRKPQGLHMTLLHVGILADLALDIAEWTKGITDPRHALEKTVAWLRGLPPLEPFEGSAHRLIVLGGGRVSGLEVEVPAAVRDYQVSLVQGLRGLLDDLLVDNVDDFILGSPALGYRYPHWTPHVAIGRPPSRDHRPVEIPQLAISFGGSRIRNAQSLP